MLSIGGHVHSGLEDLEVLGPDGQFLKALLEALLGLALLETVKELEELLLALQEALGGLLLGLGPRDLLRHLGVVLGALLLGLLLLLLEPLGSVSGRLLEVGGALVVPVPIVSGARSAPSSAAPAAPPAPESHVEHVLPNSVLTVARHVVS
ncbi:hypothetical protein LZ30DRAFT_700066 [Colletotrichum cereale]|nr:hypothetical protein LZ30DRAFT_700066 [Colletotrichum cereale]